METVVDLRSTRVDGWSTRVDGQSALVDGRSTQGGGRSAAVDGRINGPPRAVSPALAGAPSRALRASGRSADRTSREPTPRRGRTTEVRTTGRSSRRSD